MPKTRIRFLEAGLIVVAAVVVTDSEFKWAIVKAPQNFPTVGEKSGFRLAVSGSELLLRESFSQSGVEQAPSRAPKIAPQILPQQDLKLQILAQSDIIANNDRLWAGEGAESIQKPFKVSQPLPDQALPLTMASQEQISTNYDRLWVGMTPEAPSQLTISPTPSVYQHQHWAIARQQETKVAPSRAAITLSSDESTMIHVSEPARSSQDNCSHKNLPHHRTPPDPSLAGKGGFFPHGMRCPADSYRKGDRGELRLVDGHGTDYDITRSTAGSKPSLDTQPSDPQQQVFIPDQLPFVPLQGRSQRAPSIAIGTASAYGKSWGTASIGLSLQSRTRFTNTGDGGLGIGFGLGDPKQTVGLDVGVHVLDLIGDTGQDGSISFKLHRRLSPDLAVAVGVNNAIRWGETDGGESVYAVASKMFRLTESVQAPFSRLYVSAGLGGGQYRSEADIDNDVDSVGWFGSVAVQVVPQVNAIAEWTGQDLTVGISVVPFANLPLVITPAVTDITGNAGDGSRFIFSIGYGFSF